MSGKFPRH